MFIISSIDVLIKHHVYVKSYSVQKKRSEKQDIYEPKLTMYTF